MENNTVGFIINALDSYGNKVTLHFTESGYAESVLRGLIHSGFEVTIKEGVIPLSESLLKIRDFHNKDRISRRLEIRERPITSGIAAMMESTYRGTSTTNELIRYTDPTSAE